MSSTSHCDLFVLLIFLVLWFPEGGEIMMRKTQKREYVKPVSGVLIVVPKLGLHIGDLRRSIEEANLDAPHVTESFCKINVPCGKEAQHVRKIRKLSFVAEAQRYFHFDPPN